MRIALTLVCGIALLVPHAVYAAPFGGQAKQVIPCYNQAILAVLGPPIGGNYLWAPSTRTYLFGPPRHSGQWILGLSSAPWYCIITYQPLTTVPGVKIMMMGSSQ